MNFKETAEMEIGGILRTFAKYIKRNPYIDIVYSEKFGYISLLFHEGELEGAAQLPTSERVLDILFQELVNDVIFAPGNHHMLDDDLTEQERDCVRRHLNGVLVEADEVDKVYYRARLEMYLEDYPGGFHLAGIN